tara:strand:- start:1752 stop:2447 length:696 start_codon:yes stop_codon:yes gene_type:complete
MEFLKILYEAIYLIFSLDSNLYEIIFLSLKTSFLATFFASFFGFFTAYCLVIYNFKLKELLILVINSLMGIPPVVVGLIVYFIFSNQGPLGILSFLFTPHIMIIAQMIIVYPIISSLVRELLEDFWYTYKDTFKSYNIYKIGLLYTFIKNSYYFILTILLSAFGRAISEVGAVMIVGGNIEHYTRVMTTAIALETSIGNLEKAMSLGIVLLIVTMFINGIVFKFKNNREKR